MHMLEYVYNAHMEVIRLFSAKIVFCFPLSIICIPKRFKFKELQQPPIHTVPSHWPMCLY